MAPGPPLIGANRFALLADSTAIKKKKKDKKKKTTLITDLTIFPELPSIKKNDPKFVVLEAIDQNKPLSYYSCFAIHRSIRAVSSEIQSVSELRDGNILLLVKNKIIAERFLSLKELPGICNIKAKYHENLNFSKGTVFAPFLNNVPEEEIVSELSSQGVVAAYKFQRKNNDKMQPTGVVLLTFDLYHIPEKMDIAWRKVHVRQYIPNPMRCKSCQLLGHTAKFCKRSPACSICNFPPHSPVECTRTFCANCFADHPSSSNKCPKFIQAKETLKIKITNKCTLKEAIKIQKNSTPSFSENSPSFSSVVSKQNAQNENLNQSPFSNSLLPQLPFDQNSHNPQEIITPYLTAQNEIPISIISQSDSQQIDALSINSHTAPNPTQSQELSNFEFNTNIQSSISHALNSSNIVLNNAENFALDPTTSNNSNKTYVSQRYSFLPLADDAAMSSEEENE